jgi:hypothetical protein
MATKLITATVVGLNGSPFNGGTLGADLLSSSGWTSTGWTGSYAAGFTHTTGNTTALTNSLAATSATYYSISITITGRTAGTVTVGFGGVTSSVLSASSDFSILTTSTGTLAITPTSTFNGTVSITIKAIGASTATPWAFPVRSTMLRAVSGFCGSIPYMTQITDLISGTVYCSTSLIADLTTSGNAGAGMVTITAASENSQVYATASTIVLPTAGIVARAIPSPGIVVGSTTCNAQITLLENGAVYLTDSLVSAIATQASTNMYSITNVASQNANVLTAAVTMVFPTDGVSLKTIPSRTVGSTACVTQIRLLKDNSTYLTDTALASIVSGS